MVYGDAMTKTAIRWPARFSPDAAAVHVVNALTIAAEPQAVWRALVHAKDWPTFYANASKVVVSGGGGELFSGVHFTWRTFGVDLKTEVQEFEPFERIAWPGDERR